MACGRFDGCVLLILPTLVSRRGRLMRSPRHKPLAGSSPYPARERTCRAGLALLGTPFLLPWEKVAGGRMRGNSPALTGIYPSPRPSPRGEGKRAPTGNRENLSSPIAARPIMPLVFGARASGKTPTFFQQRFGGMSRTSRTPQTTHRTPRCPPTSPSLLHFGAKACGDETPCACRQEKSPHRFQDRAMVSAPDSPARECSGPSSASRP